MSPTTGDRVAASRPKVLLIGPVLPFRGGIAQHTTMLLRAFAEFTDAHAISFTRQYPKVLFPGESDRDPAFEGHVEPLTDYVIDSVNPFTWGTAVKRALAMKPNLVVLPWWQVYWAPSFSYIARRLRAAGIPVVFLCHNVVEHETASWKRWLTRSVLSLGSGYVVHTEIDATNLRELLPSARPVKHPHPAYDQFPDAKGTLPREHALELLFFGFVRHYKGLDVLLEALALVGDDSDLRLTVAGEFWKGSEETERLIASLGVGDRVELVSRYLTEEEVAEYFARAHAVVLPYRDATGSGVVAVAYHYNKPVIVTRVGGLPDVVDHGETGLVVDPESPDALARAIKRLAGTDLEAMAELVHRYKSEKLTWDGLARAVLEAGGVR